MIILKNKDVRIALLVNNVKHHEVASVLEVTEFTFCRWLRKEVSNERKAAILAAIDKLAKRSE